MTSVLALSVGGAWGEVQLNADFDHGSLRSWSGDAHQIRLVGRDNYYGGGQWRWLYFQVSGVDGQRPVFEISSNFAGGSSRLAKHQMVYSYDNEQWFFFESNELQGAAFQFFSDTAFTHDSVYVAYAPAYPYARSVSHTRTVLTTPWAEPTGSADSRGVIGQSPGGIDDLGRSIEPRDLFGYRITNTATDSEEQAKRKVVLTSGLHPGETLGTYTLEGLINWLVSDDVRAAQLRDVAEFYIYPVLNPDGRFAGCSRSTVGNVSQDPNRLWARTLWRGHQEIEVSGEAMIADVRSTPGNKVEAFIDFHSTIPASPGDDFGYLEFEQGDNLADFWLQLRRLQPNIREVDSTSITWTTANFAEAFLRAEVDITFETQFGKDRPLGYYQQLGENFGVAFHDAWVPEPASCVLFSGGLLLLLNHRARFRKSGRAKLLLSRGSAVASPSPNSARSFSMY